MKKLRVKYENVKKDLRRMEQNFGPPKSMPQ